MEATGASTAGSDHPPRKGWFERRTLWPAVVIVLLVTAVVAIPVGLDHAVAESTSIVAHGDTATLTVEDEARVTVEPIPGWERVDSPPKELHLRNDEATVSMSVADSVDDLDRYYQRLASVLRMNGVQALPGEPRRTDTGFSGLTGMLVVDGKTGEISVLAKGDTMLTVQDLVPPDHAKKLQPPIAAMVDSVREP